jgi:DNA invertase Pin-like site-specific DNA recombinase
MMYGYARVSSKGQDTTNQVDELRAAGCERIFQERASAAAGRKRPALRQALAVLERGDCLVVTRLNRLARSARDALNILSAVNEKGADIRSLREVWADTTTAHGRLVITIMSGLAEFDREMIAERTGEGRASAKARGVRLGRPPVLNAAQRRFILDQRNADPPATIGDLQRILGVSRATIVRASKEPAPEPEPPPPVWHAPTCAVFTSGAGNTVRCTCGGVGHGAGGLQMDIEELIRREGRPT